MTRLIAFSEVVLFASHDQEFVATVANRIIEIAEGGAIDRTWILKRIRGKDISQSKLSCYLDVKRDVVHSVQLTI